MVQYKGVQGPIPVRWPCKSKDRELRLAKNLSFETFSKPEFDVNDHVLRGPKLEMSRGFLVIWLREMDGISIK
jgi:hypothetical protein